GCASILWRSADKTQEAAAAMRITAQDLLDLKIIDDIVHEPPGGAHRAPQQTISAVGNTITRALSELEGLSPTQLRQQRRDKYLAMGRSLNA
ncbi:MAG TPA: acetyl-CoA carboxylase carboxyl transferase subunit alpha, partial [Rhizomicrobium sp.]